MEVPEGVGWDRKRSSEPNLHVYGEDGIKKAVYNMKGKHAERDRNIEKNTKNTQEKSSKTKELYFF